MAWWTGRCSTDSTHLKANADKHRVDRKVVAKSRSDYWEALGEAVGQDRAAHGKKPLKQKSQQPVEKETKVSRTDQEAGYMVRDGKPKASPRGSSIWATGRWMGGWA